MSQRFAPKAGTALRRQVMKAVLAMIVTAPMAALAVGAGGSARASTAGQTADRTRTAAVLPGRIPAVQATLSEVSCKGPAFCLAVGEYSEPGHHDVRLAEKWNGKTWRIVADPLRGVIHSLTCGSPSFCLGIRLVLFSPGDGTPHAVIWNGRTWQNFKHPPAELGDFSCGSPVFCANIASNIFTIQEWNGTTWREMAGSECQGEDCSWNQGLSCASATNCVATGTACTDQSCESRAYFDAIWNGRTWDQVVPTPFAVDAEGCAGPSFCMITATPSRAAFTRDWYGHWHDASPNLAAACHGLKNCSLDGTMACGTPRSCLEVQTELPQLPTPAHLEVSLAWNGATWAAARVARAYGGIPHLTDLSCGSGRNCIAVGSYQRTPHSRMLPVAEHWNGSTWQFTPIPLP